MRDWVKAFRIQAIYMFGNGYARSRILYIWSRLWLWLSLSLSLCVYDGMRDLGVIRPPRTQPPTLPPPPPPMIIDLPPSASPRIAIKFDDFLFFYTLTPPSSFGSVFFSSSLLPLLFLFKNIIYKKDGWGGCDAPAGGHISRELGHLSFMYTYIFPPWVSSLFSHGDFNLFNSTTVFLFSCTNTLAGIASIYFHAWIAFTKATVKRTRAGVVPVSRVISMYQV